MFSIKSFENILSKQEQLKGGQIFSHYLTILDDKKTKQFIGESPKNILNLATDPN